MDAPYSHRDFKRPQFTGPMDEGIRELVVRRDGRWHGFTLTTRRSMSSAGTARSIRGRFPILAFQPRVSSMHLPPTWHGTFAARAR